MNNNYQIKPVGYVEVSEKGFSIKIEKEFLPGLTNLEGFSHIQVVWWGHLYDKPQYRKNLMSKKPYKTGPDVLGVFATHSPVRPNPILLTTIDIQNIDYEKGIIYTSWIDAEKGTPVLDIKPYHLEERIRDCKVPVWCEHWPKWGEDSGTFNWQDEFNF